MKKRLLILAVTAMLCLSFNACKMRVKPPAVMIDGIEFEIAERFGNILEDENSLAIRNTRDGTELSVYPKYLGRSLQYTEYELATEPTDPASDQVQSSKISVQVCNTLRSEQEITECKIFSVLWRIIDPATGQPYPVDMKVKLLDTDFRGMTVEQAEEVVLEAKYKPNEALTTDALKVYDRDIYRICITPSGDLVGTITAQWMMNVVSQAEAQAALEAASTAEATS